MVPRETHPTARYGVALKALGVLHRLAQDGTMRVEHFLLVVETLEGGGDLSSLLAPLAEASWASVVDGPKDAVPEGIYGRGACAIRDTYRAGRIEGASSALEDLAVALVSGSMIGRDHSYCGALAGLRLLDLMEEYRPGAG